MSDHPPVEPVVENLLAVRERIARACRDSGRALEEVELVCVSKTFESEAILPVLQAGQLVFGENRVQEAQGKWPGLRGLYPDVKLHLIGPLQSNKAEDAVALFDVIETVDRPKIAVALARAMESVGRRPRLFVQVNTGEEPQKAGAKPSELAGLLALCRNELHLQIDGLMCIPPVDRQVSPHFALLRRMARDHGVENLSMGMSEDFELAVQVGATHVRVGSAIFGGRARMAPPPIAS